jgi:hypothetical protein
MNPLAFTPRACKSEGVFRVTGISCKLYIVRSRRNAQTPTPSRAALAAILEAEFSAWGTNPADHDLGFAIIHFADDGWYLLLSRWNDANNLRHRVRAIEFNVDGITARPLADPWIVSCVWELRVMMFEADAWIDTILRPGPQTITAQAAQLYLSKFCEGDI